MLIFNLEIGNNPPHIIGISFSEILTFSVLEIIAVYYQLVLLLLEIKHYFFE